MNGEIEDLSPPDPNAIRIIATISPPVLAPSCIAIGTEVAKRIAAPHSSTLLGRSVCAAIKIARKGQIHF